VSWTVDHIVVAARDLDEGVAWCEATFGIVPGPGGKHALMGTHNRLFAIGSARYPRAYFEIIAIDPGAPPHGRTRWYDLDDPALQHALARGPALVHWVAGCAGIAAEIETLRAAGIERGEVLRVERATARGPLRWRISVRTDGARLADGACPTLIEWDDVHPADAMPASGVHLEELALAGLPDVVARRLPDSVKNEAAGAALVARFATSRGPVTLNSLSLTS
jgi:hypothetical protein